MNLKSKLPTVGTTIFSVMSALANEHGALNLSQGFPNFPTDPKLLELVTRAMKAGHNQYAPMPGVLRLRELIANSFLNAHDATYNPESEITITAGATQAIFTAIAAFIHKNDEVIVFTPAYDCYGPAVEIQGGKIVSYQMKAPDYSIDWQMVKELINEKTRMIIINTPHNPSGTVLTAQDMKNLESLVRDTEILVLSDEVYQHIIFDEEKHQSASSFSGLKERSLITGSFGKSFHTTGWKLGYCCAPEYLMKEFRKVHQFNVFSVNHPMQRALAEYMENPETYLSLGKFYEQKRDVFLKALQGSRFKILPSKGTYFQPLDYTEITDEADTEFAKRLTIDYKVASIPMSVFNTDGLDQKQLRFCFAKTDETLLSAAQTLCKI